MRLPAVLLMFVSAAAAQFRSTVPLVVAPTTVTDSKGHFVDGLAPEDLLLYDNNVRQPIQLDYEVYPVSLVVAVQTNLDAEAAVDKLGRSGILFANLVAGEAGETAILTFDEEVRIKQDFTGDPDKLKKALESLKAGGSASVALDAIAEGLHMLARRPANRRRILLVIAEKRERHSNARLKDLVEETQRQNALIYWVTYSALLTPFTARPKTVKSKDPKENGTPVVSQAMPGDFLTMLAQLYHLSQPNLADLFTKATGARTFNFLKRSGLEEAIHAVGEEVHRQYIVSFQPASAAPGQFHELRVEVKGRPDLKVRSRAGYWTLQ